MKVRTTPLGAFQQDASGLWHYHHMMGSGTVDAAARDALQHLPNYTPAWFWFNGTPCPIGEHDNVSSLTRGWECWRRQIQSDPGWLLEALQRLTQGRKTEPEEVRYWLSVSALPWQEATQEQFIAAEQAAGFYPKLGGGPLATNGFGAGSVNGRVTRGEISVATGYSEDFVRIANAQK